MAQREMTSYSIQNMALRRVCSRPVLLPDTYAAARWHCDAATLWFTPNR